MPALYFQSPLLDVEPIGENRDAIGVTIVQEQNAFLLHNVRTLARDEIAYVRARTTDYHAYFEVRHAPNAATAKPRAGYRSSPSHKPASSG